MKTNRAYMSHPIRGMKGAAATEADMEANNQLAIGFAKTLRAAFPALDIYVPAEHDEFVLIAYQQQRLSESDILDTDVAILKRRDILIAYIPERHISNGMMREIHEAQWAGIPVVFLRDADDIVYLHHALQRLEESDV